MENNTENFLDHNTKCLFLILFIMYNLDGLKVQIICRIQISSSLNQFSKLDIYILPDLFNNVLQVHGTIQM